MFGNAQTTGLRRRRPDTENPGNIESETLRQVPVDAPSPVENTAQQRQTMAEVRTTTSKYYWRLTAIGALLALLTTSNPKPLDRVMRANAVPYEDLFLSKYIKPSPLLKIEQPKSRQKTPGHSVPPWLRWIPGLDAPPPPPPASDQNKFAVWGVGDLLLVLERSTRTEVNLISDWKNVLRSTVDPALFQPSDNILTDLIDKVLTSQWRLLWIVNVFLAGTYCFHQAVADWCLGLARHRLPREQRLGGFLLFKFMLMVVVLHCDTLDFIILLSWYTCLSVLRSWSSLCAGTTLHAAHVGVVPPSGAWQLLIAVLLSNCFLMAVNVGLFYPVGWNMILLLMCDCVLLAIDVMCHLMAHLGDVLEQRHEEADWVGDDSDGRGNSEYLEAMHTRRLSILSTASFGMQIFGHVLTVVHYLHIWRVYGLNYTLIDGILMMYLNSSVTSLVHKVAERRQAQQLAQDLDVQLPDATTVELQKASANGDVCCICLQQFNGSTKKIACGHLYHVSCLQQVLHRARSIESAQCPLCRANVVRDPGSSDNSPVAQAPHAEPDTGNPRAVEQTDALFRFSTENIIPNWLPIPGFSFEVVRRPATEPTHSSDVDVQPASPERPNIEPDTLVRDVADADEDAPEHANPAPGPVAPDPSPFRRLMILLGVLPMSPEEEAAAMGQLVEMFPQYNRVDLLRELRDRGSAEAVAELAINGVITPSTSP